MKNYNSKFKKFYFLFAFLIFAFCISNVANAALLYLDPDKGDYGPGDTFIVNVRIDNEGECINAVDVQVGFPANLLRAADFSRGGSILSLWVYEPVLDNEHGIVSFSGGIPAGYCGRISGDPALSNILGKIVFSVSPGAGENDANKTAGIEILSSSQVLLNDGLGGSAKTTMDKAEFTIHSLPVSPKNEWLEELSDDKIPPEAFTVSIQKDKGVYGGKYYIIFSTTDKQSGIDYFEILENGTWKRIESPYLLKDQKSLMEIKVRAFDKAGNERAGEYLPEQTLLLLEHETNTGYFIFLLIVGILTVVGLYLQYKYKNNDKANI